MKPLIFSPGSLLESVHLSQCSLAPAARAVDHRLLPGWSSAGEHVRSSQSAFCAPKASQGKVAGAGADLELWTAPDPPASGLALVKPQLRSWGGIPCDLAPSAPGGSI